VDLAKHTFGSQSSAKGSKKLLQSSLYPPYAPTEANDMALSLQCPL